MVGEPGRLLCLADEVKLRADQGGRAGFAQRGTQPKSQMQQWSAVAGAAVWSAQLRTEM